MQNLNSDTTNESYSCTQAVKAYSARLETKRNGHLEMLRSQLAGAMELVETLQEKYSQAIHQDLLELEKYIKTPKK